MINQEILEKLIYPWSSQWNAEAQKHYYLNLVTQESVFELPQKFQQRISQFT